MILSISLELIEVQAGIDPIQDLRLIIRRQMGEAVPSQKRILMSKPKLVESCPVGEAYGDKVRCCLWEDAEQMKCDAVEDMPATAFQYLNQGWDQRWMGSGELFRRIPNSGNKQLF
jgi:hypothetical protein